MDSVKILDEPITKRPELKTFNVKKHKKQVFNMFAGESTNVTIRIDPTLIDAMYDKFGSSVKMRKTQDDEVELSVEVQVSPAFIGWCVSFGSRLRVVSPTDVIEKIKAEIEKLQEQYN
jgi:predicted DNA-binding transcriptional regulator YafY